MNAIIGPIILIVLLPVPESYVFRYVGLSVFLNFLCALGRAKERSNFILEKMWIVF